MSTFILCVGVAIVFFGLGAWIWPKVTGEEAKLRDELAAAKAAFNSKPAAK